MEARRAHNPEVVGSSPTSATTKTDTKRCLFFIIYLDSKFGLEPTTRGSKCASIWEKQSGGLFRSECAISVLPPQPPKQTPNGVCFLLFIWTRNLDSNLRHEAPNAQAFGRNSPGDCFVASAQSRSYLRNHQDGVCLRRLFSFTGLKPTFILHINRHRQARCLFYCQRQKRIDLTIENMV